jgi:pimeloyl-ACP methyl ester carboxylesterase
MKRFIIILAGVGLAMALNGCSSTSQWYHLPPLEFDQFDYGYPVRHAEVDGMDIAYIDEGRGDHVLLLIHGLGTNAKGWQRNIPALSREFRVIALDLPGYGMSSKGAYPYSMDFHARVCDGLLAVLGIDEAVWVGHSMGGQIALTAALDLPERVGALVLLSTAGFEAFEEGEGDWMKSAVTPEFVHDSTIRQIARNLHSNFHETPPEAEFFITDRIQMRGAKDFDEYCYAVWRNVAAMIDGPTHARLETVDRPALIIFGEHDGLIPNPYLHGGFTRDVAEIGHRAIPDSELLMLPECGHMTMFEKPDEVNAAVRDFVDNL